MKIVIAEPMSAAGIELLKEHKDWEIIISNPKEYAEHLPTADALIVRSAVKVNADVLAKAPRLRVIGRAGVGVDNVDIPASTAAGVLVMNTPGGNAVSVAEHTMALMLSLARSIPAATSSTKSGKWEKKKFLGSELRGKTMGIVGLGSVGREVAKRAHAFEMHVLAYDPYVSTATAADRQVDLVDLKTLFAKSDYIGLHVGLTPETENMISAEAISTMKPNARIINCARGELIDNAALVEALNSGRIAGAGIDVFRKEPPEPTDPLLSANNLLSTPHIGGSTEEAQEIVGVRIAEQIVEYLLSGVAVNAVNMPSLSPDQYKAMGPYVDLAERLGNFAAYVSNGNPNSIRLTYFGKIAESNTTLLRNAGIAGVLNRSVSTKANLVNSMAQAQDRGWIIRERHEKRIRHVDSIRIELETDTGTTTVEGALVLDRPRLVQIDGIYCEAPLAGNITFLKNEDVPGVIGYIGSVLGKNEINIANFSLGRQESVADGQPLEAVCVIETDAPVPDKVLVELLRNHAVKMARAVSLYL